MIEGLLMLMGLLLTVTIGAAIEYYKHICKAQKEYEKARGIIEDIVLSFNRELKRNAENTEALIYKVEGSAAKAETSLKKAENIEKKLAVIENALSVLSEKYTSLLSKTTEVETKTNNVEAACQTLKIKITEIEEQVQKASAMPEIKSEPVIPIRRDKAMSALTDTEVAVLELLTAEGPKTAPEIRDKIGLSREHTARLMKKLYEEGYLERETGKIPFRYSVKKEMVKFLKKAESEQV
ncbi:MAG: MarR family transcriptional regulator [Candidatus Bathyarchaeota archaeon]|nr:MarR family transcriptional regulator [Candidatus Bathyarchaeota archaeon]